MILIFGGAYQGKWDYARKLTGYRREDFADGAVCDPEAVFAACGVVNFHEYIRRCLARGETCEGLAQEIADRNPELVIVTTELGCGIVPAEPFDRLWRETVGRVCTELAGRADKVCRVLCGVGMVLKDDGRD